MKKKIKPLFEKKKFFWITSDIFKIDIACFLNYTHPEMVVASKKVHKELHKYLSDIKQEEDSIDQEGQLYPLPKGFAIRIKTYTDEHRKNIGTIAHEITHLVQYILRDRRVTLNETTEEVYAYLTEDLLKKFLYKWY